MLPNSAFVSQGPDFSLPSVSQASLPETLNPEKLGKVGAADLC